MPKPSLTFEALGTQWFIESASGISPQLERAIHSALQEVDARWSRFRDDSMVATMAKTPGSYPLSPGEYGLMRWYERLYQATEGCVSPLIGKTLSDAGYDSQYSLRPRAVIAKTPVWSDVIELTPGKLTMKQPWLVDVGAAGKGYAIDKVAALLKDAPYLIDAGGDLRTRGGKQTIGLEDPRDPSRLIGTFTVEGQSLCASAGNRRVWGQWHHIINPKTSQPVKDIIATWAVAADAMTADGLASALFFVPPEKLQLLGTFSFVVMYADGQVYHTDSSKLTLFH